MAAAAGPMLMSWSIFVYRLGIRCQRQKIDTGG
jgi:hypothetical protein